MYSNIEKDNSLNEKNNSNIEIDVILGGEPLLHFDEIKKYILNSKKQIKVSTNGTLLTKEIIDFFIKTNTLIQLSYDGLWNYNRNKHLDNLIKWDYIYELQNNNLLNISCVYSGELNLVKNYELLKSKFNKIEFRFVKDGFGYSEYNKNIKEIDDLYKKYPISEFFIPFYTKLFYPSVKSCYTFKHIDLKEFELYKDLDFKVLDEFGNLKDFKEFDKNLRFPNIENFIVNGKLQKCLFNSFKNFECLNCKYIKLCLGSCPNKKLNTNQCIVFKHIINLLKNGIQNISKDDLRKILYT